jgi:hypothetical protein
MVVYFVRNFTGYLNWYLNRPLRVKLVASMVVVVILGTGAINAVLSIQSTRRLQDTTAEVLGSMASRQGEEIGLVVATQMEKMTSMAISSGVIESIKE